MDFDDHDEPDEEMGLPKPATTTAAAATEPSGHHRKGTGSNKYRECLKNHAVGIGGHAVDGCGEFMAAGEEGTLDGLRCAACSCHRNFHRKEPDFPSAADNPFPTSPPHFSPYYRTPAGYLTHHPQHFAAAAAAAAAQQRAAAAPLALPSTSGEQEDFGSDPAGGSGSKKRFRTKFTAEQKDKMLAFAERVGWRIQKHDEAAVQEFCGEAAVKRHVLKVWMHNNKHTLGKKP